MSGPYWCSCDGDNPICPRCCDDRADIPRDPEPEDDD